MKHSILKFEVDVIMELDDESLSNDRLHVEIENIRFVAMKPKKVTELCTEIAHAINDILREART